MSLAIRELGFRPLTSRWLPATDRRKSAGRPETVSDAPSSWSHALTPKITKTLRSLASLSEPPSSRTIHVVGSPPMTWNGRRRKACQPCPQNSVTLRNESVQVR